MNQLESIFWSKMAQVNQEFGSPAGLVNLTLPSNDTASTVVSDARSAAEAGPAEGGGGFALRSYAQICGNCIWSFADGFRVVVRDI